MCSGADPDYLVSSPKSEQIKFAGIGGTVFFTAIMAFIAASYALYTVFDNIPLSILFGLIWGLLIFNLDRFIVSSIKKTSSKSDEIIQVLPRIILAVIIAIVISKPLELKIFEKEIDQVLLTQKNALTLDNQEQIGLIFAKEKLDLDNKIASINNTLALKEQEVNALYSTYIAEAEGREGTKLLGKGPVYQEKRDKHDLKMAELQGLKTESKEQKALLTSQLALMTERQKTQIASSQPIIDGFDGLMARIKALGELPFLPSFFIFLLFLAIETSPILAKLLSPKGVYDIRLANFEHKEVIWAEQQKRQRELILNADTALNKKVLEALKNEDESYHYKKQKARALLHHQADVFLNDQKELIGG
ncbi:MAG: hypothetical protein ACI8XB_001058 [Patiriisocius sp.]|jgi:hypothetical protein